MGRSKTASFWRVLIAVVLAGALGDFHGVSGDTVGLPRDCHLNEVAPNPRNRHTFYWCLAEGPVLWKCVNDLVFEPSEKKCISKEDQLKLQEDDTTALRALGDNKLIHFQEHKNKGPGGTSPLLQKPVQPSGVVPPLSNVKDYVPHWNPCMENLRFGEDIPTIYLRNPGNCSQFYTCSNGLPILQECPTGLVFNPKSNVSVCDYPRNVPSCMAPPRLQPAPPRKVPSFQRDQDDSTTITSQDVNQFTIVTAAQIAPILDIDNNIDSPNSIPEPLSPPSPLDDSSSSPVTITSSPF